MGVPNYDAYAGDLRRACRLWISALEFSTGQMSKSQAPNEYQSPTFGYIRHPCRCLLPRLRGFDVKIDHDWILTASYDDSFTGFVVTSVDLLVGHVRGNIDEIARSGFTAEFQAISPSHASPAANDEEDCF